MTGQCWRLCQKVYYLFQTVHRKYKSQKTAAHNPDIPRFRFSTLTNVVRESSKGRDGACRSQKNTRRWLFPNDRFYSTRSTQHRMFSTDIPEVNLGQGTLLKLLRHTGHVPLNSLI